MLLRATIFLLCLLIACSAYAEDDYSDVTLHNFAETLVRFKAIDIKDDALLDDYALITDCDLVENFFENDFRWSQVRSLIRDSVKINIDSFPATYHHDTMLQLARYDFKGKIFRFTDLSALHNVNSFSFRFTNKGQPSLCNGKNPTYIPSKYSIVIGTPVSINGLPFSEHDANDLLQRLEAAGNTDRIIYVRFNITIVSINRLRKTSDPGFTVYKQDENTLGAPMRIDGRLDSVNFYEDAEHTKKLYGFAP